MAGVIHDPTPKLSLLFKCVDCGHKFKPLIFFLPGKCPHCSGGKLKPAIGFKERKLLWVVN